MSRSSSPAPAPDPEHSEHSPKTQASQPPHDASPADRESSEPAAANRNHPSRSVSRETSNSPSALDDPSTVTSTPAPEPSGSGSGHSPSGPPPSAWQAVWSPAHNAYYFYNSLTQETTWLNPLQPSDAEAGPSTALPAPSSTSTPDRASSTDPSSSSTAAADIYAAAVAQGIDPALAHLDPSLLAGPSNPGAFTYTAKFNARTGAFAKTDARDPSHLSEYERAKRMSEFYFDVNAWEREVEMRKLQEAQEEESRKRKRPTKKDIERFKEKKKQKKLAKTAWLRT